ncbi:MAG: T9SS type A sorting domain-containing protein [Aequorivita antarctica]
MKIKLLFLLALACFINMNGQIGFEDYTVIDRSNSTQDVNTVALADLDGDGDLDLISGSAGDDKVVWFKNIDGQGTFSTQILIDDFVRNVTDVKAGDLDGDGDLDIIYSSSFDDMIFWAENLDGNGTFNGHVIISQDVNGPLTVNLTDIDGDGDLDFFSGAYSQRELAWFENTDGLANFGPKQIIYSNSVSQAARSIFSTDLDNDGDMDLMVAFTSSPFKVSWFENTDGLGSFGTEKIISEDVSGAVTVTSADIDNDGDYDVLSASTFNEHKIVWYENDSSGNFDTEHIITDSWDGSSYIEVADIDGDGDLDVYGTSVNEDTIGWFENNNGLGSFSNLQVITTMAPIVREITFGDIDNDGDVDLASVSTSDDTVVWYRNEDGFGTYSEEIVVSYSVDLPFFVSSGDINGDGFIDAILVSQSDGKISWHENLNGTGSFGTQHIINSSIGAPFASLVADFDGDGDLDVIAAYNSGGISLFENEDGLGIRWVRKNMVNAGSLKSISKCDLDGDGDMDFITASFNSIYFYENLDGLGNFSSFQHIAGVNGSAVVYAVDIDSDGDLDILQASSGDDSVGWFENTGGTFGTRNIISDNLIDVSSFSTNDINNDGNIDVVVESSNMGIVWFENLDGLGVFGSALNVANDILDSTCIVTADLDVDGDMDVISTSLYGDSVSWHENIDGNGNFASSQLISNLFNGARSIEVANFDGDGDLDFILASSFDDTFTYFENLGVLGNQIFGNIRIDLNTNGCDGTDLPMPNIMVYTNNGSHDFATFTQPNGNYSLLTNEGDFITKITSALPTYYVSDPSEHSSNFVGLGNSDEADFCIVPNQTIDDLTISIYPLIDARPGFEASYQLVYRNVGTTILSGSVNLVFDYPKLTFLNASDPIASQTDNSLTFDYTNLYPFETRTVDVNFTVSAPPITVIDDILQFVATVNPVAGDYTEEDNTFTFEQKVVGSFDPNDIQVLEGEEIFEEETDNFLHYIIRFQNTGTAEAVNVRVNNELHPNLDWTTIQLENMSHPNRVEITNGNQVEFIFENINLPDSTTNEPASHGYIQYKIKPKNSIQIGESISNGAQIFFDFNPPIITNIVITTVVENLGVREDIFDSLSIYPIPATDFVLIKYNGTIAQTKIYNELGQLILEENDSKGIIAVDIENLSPGIYFIKLRDNMANEIVKKLIKN